MPKRRRQTETQEQNHEENSDASGPAAAVMTLGDENHETDANSSARRVLASVVSLPMAPLKVSLTFRRLAMPADLERANATSSGRCAVTVRG